MPTNWTQWSCDTCHKRFASYGEAERCEQDHVDSAATDNFKANLAEIMKGVKRNATR